MILEWMCPFGFFFERVLMGNEMRPLGPWKPERGKEALRRSPEMWSGKLEGSLHCWGLFLWHQAKAGGKWEPWWLNGDWCASVRWSHWPIFLGNSNTQSQWSVTHCPLFPSTFSVLCPFPPEHKHVLAKTLTQKPLELHPCRQSSTLNSGHQEEKKLSNI